MNNVFFLKTNSKEEVENKDFISTKNNFAGMQPGDYSFIRLAKEAKKGKSESTIRRLWRLKDIQSVGTKWVANFEEVFEFNMISIEEFISLSLFTLDQALLNSTVKTEHGSIFRLSIYDYSFFKSVTSSKERFNSYLAEESNYRQIKKVPKVEDVDSNSIDVYFYKDGESWRLYDKAPFIKEELKEKLNPNIYDNYNEYNDKDYKSILSKKTLSAAKFKMMRFLDGENVVPSLVGIYDAFSKKPLKPLVIPKNQNNKKKAYANRINELDNRENIQSINEESAYDYSKAQGHGCNKIVYGTPGCGKSYYVENKLLKQLNIDSKDEKKVFRTTFFQDYTYTDFVGQIMPKVDENKVDYEFFPGPFSLALKRAIETPTENVALVIEELNRGNAPSIFGDIFQLLDRDENGISEYKINNSIIENYLKNETKHYDMDYIRIPANLYIFATMNTSDQNVFTLDTAFKRRWKMERLSNKFNDNDKRIEGLFVPGLKHITWKSFVETINGYILSHGTSLSVEDKRLGKYFMEPEQLIDGSEEKDEGFEKTKSFAHKVMEYLWTDVAKFNRSDWFDSSINSLDDLIEEYLSEGNVFTQELASKLHNEENIATEEES